MESWRIQQPVKEGVESDLYHLVARLREQLHLHLLVLCVRYPSLDFDADKLCLRVD